MRTFLMQRWSAVALLIFLTLHMVVVHYPPGHIDVDRVLERLDDPLWKAIDIAFLAAVLIHALTGTYMVITDVQRFNVYRRAFAWVGAFAGVLLFIYGTQTILAFLPGALFPKRLCIRLPKSGRLRKSVLRWGAPWPACATPPPCSRRPALKSRFRIRRAGERG